MVSEEPLVRAAPLITTPRLVLRPFEATDLIDLHQYRSHAEWARYVSLPQPYTLTIASRDLDEYRNLDSTSHAFWAIDVDGRAVGNINADLETPFRAQMGWGIAHQFWGQGLTTEAATAVIDWVFAHPEMKRVYATADARNVASRRVMEKVGMRLEATLRMHRLDSLGELGDEVWYGLLRAEWEANRP